MTMNNYRKLKEDIENSGMSIIQQEAFIYLDVNL